MLIIWLSTDQKNLLKWFVFVKFQVEKAQRRLATWDDTKGQQPNVEWRGRSGVAAGVSVGVQLGPVAYRRLMPIVVQVTCLENKKFSPDHWKFSEMNKRREGGKTGSQKNINFLCCYSTSQVFWSTLLQTFGSLLCSVTCSWLVNVEFVRSINSSTRLVVPLRLTAQKTQPYESVEVFQGMSKP